MPIHLNLRTLLAGLIGAITVARLTPDPAAQETAISADVLIDECDVLTELTPQNMYCARKQNYFVRVGIMPLMGVVHLDALKYPEIALGLDVESVPTLVLVGPCKEGGDHICYNHNKVFKEASLLDATQFRCCLRLADWLSRINLTIYAFITENVVPCRSVLLGALLLWIMTK